MYDGYQSPTSVFREFGTGDFDSHRESTVEHTSAASIGSAVRSLVLIGRKPSEGLLSEIARGLAPRPEYLELALALEAEIISADYWKPPLARIARKAPFFAACFAASLHSRRYDAIYTTSEDLAMRLAPLLRLGGWKGRLVAVVHACLSERRKAYFRRLGPRTFHSVICVSEAQRAILIGEVGFPAEKVHALFNWVDTDFFTPDPQIRGGDEFVFSCGLTGRDYPTLLAAAKHCSMPFKFAASGPDGLAGLGEPPTNVDVLSRFIPFSELRQLYAAARFAVVPLHSAPYAAGVTGLVEAMSAGLAVVVTDSPGISEYLRSAAPGPLVPPGDPGAMAAAIRTLWEQPERCREIGARNRQWCEQNATVQGFVRRVREMMLTPH
jgi:glycosyltransferase involved in cell wall biosynthesis